MRAPGVLDTLSPSQGRDRYAAVCRNGHFSSAREASGAFAGSLLPEDTGVP